MKYVIEDASEGFRLTVESPRAEFRTEHGLTHRQVFDEVGGHGPVERLYADVVRTIDGLRGHGAPERES